jgi:DNA repair ATPase RecN
MTIPASNAPASPRRFGRLAALLRSWLGITDLRHDFDALGTTLHAKDLETDGHQREVTAAMTQFATTQTKVIEQLNQTTNGAASTEDRLRWYEERIPSISGQRKSYDVAVRRKVKEAKQEQERRVSEVAAHPEWTDAEKASVMSIGELPKPSEESAA